MATTRMSTLGSNSRSSLIEWLTSRAPARARTATRQARPPAKWRTCIASGYSTSVVM